jgi:hypothetical protein
MKRYIYTVTSIVLIITVLLFVACDRIEGPYYHETGQGSVVVEFPPLDLQSVKRKILVEEYTGFLCTNCPDGHEKLAQMIEKYNFIVPVGIHAGSLAKPDHPVYAPNGFTYDFRCPMGIQLYEDFGTPANPKAVFNRTKYNNEWAVSMNVWEEALANQDTSKILAAIQLINVFQNNKLTANAKISMLESYEQPLQLSMMLVENNFVQFQLNHGKIDSNYIHNHVLRTDLNGFYGQVLTQSGIMQKDSAYTVAYTLSFNGKDWNPDNCVIVAVLLNQETHEVIQAEMKEVKSYK